MKNIQDDPHAGVKRFRDYSSDMKESCDFLVVGTGPAGSVAALELARAGFSVVMLEEGPPMGPEDFEVEASRSMRKNLREAGLRAALGNVAMPTMQPVVLGGGSLVNSAICIRAPELVFTKWRNEHGIDWVSGEVLEPHFKKIYDYWPIAPAPEDILGRRNLLFKEGCDNLGIESHAIERNVVNCRGCAECFTGCPARAKQSTDLTFLPDAMAEGARIYANMRAEELIMEGSRVAGMRARAVDHLENKKGPMLEVRAKCTVLAAGVVGTPTILQKNNNAANSSGMVGKNLLFHPGLAIAGIFEEDVNPWEGATQGYASIHYIEEGFKLEVLWAPPAVLAVRFPGFGKEFKSYIGTIKHMAPFDVIIRSTSTGEVRARKKSWDPVLKYSLNQSDTLLLKEGLALLAEVLEAAGAHTMLPGVHSLDNVMKAKGAADKIRATDIQANHLVTGGNHVFGTTRMGADSRTSVVDPDGKSHDLDDLYIVDTGIMPTCTCVNPMFTAMALSDRISQVLKERY